MAEVQGSLLEVSSHLNIDLTSYASKIEQQGHPRRAMQWGYRMKEVCPKRKPLGSPSGLNTVWEPDRSRISIQHFFSLITNHPKISSALVFLPASTVQQIWSSTYLCRESK